MDFHTRHKLLLITMLNHFVCKHDKPYQAGQHSLNPQPMDLALRNHV